MTDMLRRGLSTGEEFFPEMPPVPAEADVAHANDPDTAPVIDTMSTHHAADALLVRSYLCEAQDPFPARSHNYTDAGAVIVAFSLRDL